MVTTEGDLAVCATDYTLTTKISVKNEAVSNLTLKAIF